MSMTKKRLDDKKQLTVFEYLARVKEGEAVAPAKAGSLHIDVELRELVSAVLKKCQGSRYQVVANMSELAGEEITKAMLDSWTAESKENHRFPLKFVPAFCSATGNHEVLTFLCRKVGLFVLPSEEALRAEIQHIDEDIKEKQGERRKRAAFLKEASDRRGR